jgi:conjugative relaxase-like TrwC/TraI family protein
VFTGVPQKDKAVAKSYFDEHLSHNDYYTQGEVEVGRWIGMGAERLGLIEGQPVDREAFMRLCDNLHPSTGILLTQRMNAERRVFFDFTCSAPKSVSIMAVTMNDERILRAHQLAARSATKELAAFAATRIRKQGSMDDRFTGTVVGAEFLHNSSRALDPQLHTHFTLFNSTFDATEQRWKALQTSGMFAAIHYATEVYRNELAKGLHALGYETVRTSKAFEIKGVSQALCTRFSKRSKERDTVVAEMEKRLGRKISNNEVSNAVHKTRSRKLKGIGTEEVRSRQLAQMSAAEIAALRSVKERADGTAVSPEPVSQEQALSYAVEHVFERDSVVPQEQVLRHALVEGRGCLDLQQLKEKVRGSNEFIRVGGVAASAPGALVSTRNILETELYLIDQMNAGKDAFTPLHPGFNLSAQLGDDQRKALELILHSPDQFTGIRGLAGTGKSTALTELSRAISAAGYEPFVCAPTGSAADVLRKDGFDAVTLEKLLVDPKLQASIGPRSVLILDEAGAVGIDDMKRFFELTIEKKARGIFSGDTGQHSSVTRGDALRILEEHSRYSFGQLTQIRRQRQTDYLKVVELAANKHPLEAFDRLDAMGDIHEPAHIYDAAAKAYLSALDQGRSALLVSPTWDEIDALTIKVRATLQERGIVGKEETTRSVLDSLSWTEAQKRNLACYEPGQVLLFQQDTGTFKQHEATTVVSASKTSVLLQCEDGSKRRFRPLKGHTFDVCEARQLAIAPGDKLLLQANRSQNANGSSAALVNGQLVTVRAVAKDGRIDLFDGRSIPPDYRKFCHGYAVTSHASQGKTVDEVLLVASARSLGAVNREQFYVSVSRGRERCQIFTDDKGLLRDKVGRSHERKAALELADLGEALKRAGFTPKTAAPVVADLQAGVSRSPAPAQHSKAAVSPLRSVELARLFREWSRKVQTLLHSLAPAQKQTQTQALPAAVKAPSLKPTPLQEVLARRAPATSQDHSQTRSRSQGYSR